MACRAVDAAARTPNGCASSFQATSDVLPFGEEDALAAGDLRAGLEAAGTPIGPYDLLIAAQALRSGTMLVTANVAEFARVRGLLWQDWTAAV